MNVIHTLNPGSAAFAQPYEWGNFCVDVQRFGRAIRGELEQPPALVRQANHHDLARLIRSAGHRREPISVDIETRPSIASEPWTGKDPSRAALHQIGFGLIGEGISIFWEDADPVTRLMVKELLLDKDVVKVFQNGWWFDIPVLQRYGMECVNVEDTRDLRRAVASKSKLSLRYLGSIYTDIHDWKSAEDDDGEDADDDGLDGKGGWATNDKNSAGEYNALDCVVTSRAWRGLVGDRAEETRRAAPVERLYAVHTRLSQIYARANRVGMYVHKEWRGFMRECLAQSMEEARATLRSLTQENFPCTPDSMRALIYKRHEKPGIKGYGLPDPYDKKMYTDDTKKTIKVDENSLLMLLVSGECPPPLIKAIDAWWHFKGEEKRLGVIKSEKFDQAMSADGRLHPGWNSCGTETMRLSCLVGSTPIQTQKGVKPLKDVRPGDYVWTHKERWRKVTAFLRRGIKSVVAVRFSNGDVLTCTDDHKLLTTDGRWTQVKDLYNESLDEQLRESAEGADYVSQRGDSDCDRNSGEAGDTTSVRSSGAQDAHAGSGAQSARQVAVFGVEVRNEKPDEGEDRTEASQLGGGVRRRVRVPDVHVAREETLRASSGDDGSLGRSSVTGRDGRTPHRQRPEEQFVGQSRTRHAIRSPFHSLFTGEGQPGRLVEEIVDCGSAEVYDLTVDEDHSFEACGVFAHNCSSPNVQNIEEILRHVIAPTPGRALVHMDKSQLELRVMEMVADDHILHKALLTGDVYTFDALQWYKIDPKAFHPKDDERGPANKKDKKTRTRAKIGHLSRQYGAGDQTAYASALRQDRNISFNEIRLQGKSFVQTYYRTAAYWEEEMRRVYEKQYSEGRIIGGRLYHPMPPERSKAANFPVQRTAGEMMNLETIELFDRLRDEVPDAELVAQVHDAIDVECKESDVEKVKKIMQETHDREWTFCGKTRPFPIDLKVAYSSLNQTWADV